MHLLRLGLSAAGPGLVSGMKQTKRRRADGGDGGEYVEHRGEAEDLSHAAGDQGAEHAADAQRGGDQALQGVEAALARVRSAHIATITTP